MLSQVASIVPCRVAEDAGCRRGNIISIIEIPRSQLALTTFLVCVSQRLQAFVYAGAHVDHTGTHPAQETPLHWACRNANSEMVKTLLSLGADIHKRDAHGYTCVHHLCGSENAGEGVGLLHYLAAAG